MTPLIDPTAESTRQLMVNVVYERIAMALATARPGHCLRISALPEPVMRALCARFQAEGASADVVLLLGPHQTPRLPFEVSATRLIALRNAETRPLLAFVPPGLKTAAEDSFDISTFSEIKLTDVAGQLRRRLHEQLPESLRPAVRAVVEFVESRNSYTDDEIVLYYQTILTNGATPAAVGGALYRFGLIPHFKLADTLHQIYPELRRNAVVMETLSDNAWPLLGRIHKLKLRPDTLQSPLHAFLRQHGSRGPRHWTRLIATTPEHLPLAIDKWQFAEEAEQSRILIWFEDLALPRRQPDQPPGNDNPPTLDIGRERNVRLKWRLEAKPTVVAGLSHYRMELVDADHTIIWESRNIPVGSGQSLAKSKTLKVAEFRELVADEADEGMYFFRVRAYSETGELLAQEDPDQNSRVLRDRTNPGSKLINESDNFWLWNGRGEGPDVEPPRNVSVISFEEARLLTHLSLIDRREDPSRANPQPREDRTGWGTKATGRQTEAIYHIVYDAQTSYTLAVNNVLRRLEQSILAQPQQLGRFVLDFSDPTTTPARVEPRPHPGGPYEDIPDYFLSARETVFAAIGRSAAADQGLVATADLPTMEDAIVAYAQAFGQWLATPGGDAADAPCLDLDTVDLLLPDSAQARLVGPTHPLRLLWHLQQARLGRGWLVAALTQGDAAARLPEPVRLFLRRGLAPVNLPLVLLDSQRPAFDEAFVEQGVLTPFWSLYVRQSVRDKQTLRARVQRALGISYKAAPQAGELDPAVLAGKLTHYLAQHPYLHTLKINAFNPGNAALIVDTMLLLESKQRSRPDNAPLRYELRLFSQSRSLDDVGEAVEELMNPDRQVKAEADAFTVAGRNHLFPKLRYSRHNLRDFLDEPERFEAHVTILRDLFPVKAQAVAAAGGRSSYLYGLIQEQTSAFAADDQHFVWQRQLVPCPTPELDRGAAISALLAALLKGLGQRQTALATDASSPTSVPGLALDLPISEKSLLYEVHATSDWVFTLDRYLGLEYFDSAATPGRPLYLLDFTPPYANADAERMLLTTRVVDEVARLVQPVLQANGLALAGGDAVVFFLQLLRSLSGRLALRLIAAPNQGKEAISLALARLFLEEYGILREAIVIPLDAHADLFAPEHTPAGEATGTATRGDLLLVTADPLARRLNFHVIEVKWRADLSGFGEAQSLRQQVTRQLAETEQSLRRRFDPDYAPIDRLDRPMRTKELMTLLVFYLDRARRYSLVSEKMAAELRDFFQNLDAGYQLAFSGSGLFFDRSYEGLTSDAEQSGRVYHRLGRDYVSQLLDNALAQQPGRAPETLATEPAPKATPPDRPPMRDDPTYDRVRSHFPLPHTEQMSDRTPAASSASGSAAPIVRPHRRGSDHAAAASNGATSDDADVESASPPGPVALAAKRPDPSPITKADLSGNILLGLDSHQTRQFGILGKSAGQRVALDLNGTNTISLFGVQGGGKSYSVGAIVEMATRALPGLSELPSPLATVIFHYHESQDYAPEFVSMIRANSAERDVMALRDVYEAEPAALDDVLLLTSPDMVAARRREFPGVRVAPILFSSSELGIKEWRFLMGVTGNQMYMKQMTMLIRQLRRQEDGAVQLDALRAEIDASALSDMQKTILSVRLNIAAQFIDDASRLSDYIRPGRLIIVDLRDETIEKDEALGLFVVMLNIFAGAGRSEGYNKLIVFDEAHKYMNNRDLTGHIVDAIRQMRHQGVSLLIASQDPPSLPNEIIELSSLVILHRFNSPQWLKHVQRAVTALSGLTPTEMAALRPGEAYVWSAKATEPLFTQKAVRMQLRPRATEHGGGTRTAV